jgi:alpha-L-fucosidase
MSEGCICNNSGMMPTAADRVQWFRDARFGLFLHWGLYSVLGRNEWSIYLDRWSLAEYEGLADRFVPRQYDPQRWAAMAVESGAKYLVLTTRHHDGFCLFDSAVSRFSSVQRAAKRDLVAEYVAALHSAGLKVGLYYSLSDWRFKGHWDAVRYPESAAAMVAQTHAQVRELLTQYGRIDLLWYDGGGWSDPAVAPRDAYRSAELNAMARHLQPHLLINDRSGWPEDFGTPETVIKPSEEESRPWESCLQMDEISWGHVPHSPNLRTPARLVAEMVEVAAGAGNLLLNTGPTPDGEIRPEEERRIRVLGEWLTRYGACLYGSRRSRLSEHGVMGSANRHARWIGTPDPCVHYLAALCWMGDEFFTVLIDGRVEEVTLMPTGEPVAFTQGAWGRLTFTGLPATPPDPLCTLFKVRFAAPPALLAPSADGSWLVSPY